MNVLIVDDELLVRTGVHSLIPATDERFTVAGDARSGEEALNLIPSLQPVIVISDIVMPGMTGLQLLNRCRELGFAVAFVFLTSHRDFDYARHAVEMGATDYLLKHELHPQRLASVLDRAYKALEERGLISRPTQSSPPRSARKPADAGGVTRMLVLRIEHYHRIAEQRDVAALGSLLITMVQQVSGPGMRITLDSSTGGLWWFRIQAASPETTPMASRAGLLRFGTRLIETLRTSMNLMARVGISLRDAATHSPFFDNAFCSTDSVVLEENADRRPTSPPAPTSPDSGAPSVSAAVQRLLRLIEQQQTDSLRNALSEFESVCRDRLIPRDSMLLEATSILTATHTAISRIDPSQTAETERIFVSLQRSVRDAAYGGTVISALSDAFDAYETRLLSAHRELLPEEIARVREFIHREFRRPISLEEAASVAGKSPSYFSTLFHRTLGVGFVEYVNRVRIDAAVTLLRDPRATVAEVGARCGFPNDKYFARTFKRIMGISPGSMRSKNRAPEDSRSGETR